jgi:endoglucanase
MKEGGGGDNLAVAWQYPGQPRVVIPAEFSRVLNPSLAGATLDTWTGISGLTIADLRSSTNNLADTPDKSERLVNLLESPRNVGDNYGSRMSGWLVPPITGPYEFWIASDDQGEFWLSTDESPTNRARRCTQLSWVSPREWDKFPEQKSSPISLVAGQAYYYEV